MRADWVAQSEAGDWTAIPRESENPTRRERIEAAVRMREFVGYGWECGDEFRELVRDMEPIMVTHFTGEAALDESEGAFTEFWAERDDSPIKAWCVQ